MGSLRGINLSIMLSSQNVLCFLKTLMASKKRNNLGKSNVIAERTILQHNAVYIRARASTVDTCDSVRNGE